MVAKKKVAAKKAPARKKVAVKKAPIKKAPAKKVAVKKAPIKRAAVKRAPAAKAAPKAAVVKKITAIREPMSRTALFTTIAERTELSKKDVAAVFEELSNLIDGHIRKRAAGTFTLPGLLKVKTIRKPAQKARKNVPNPFKPGEMMDVAAKPARTVVKVQPLKKLKDFASN